MVNLMRRQVDNFFFISVVQYIILCIRISESRQRSELLNFI